MPKWLATPKSARVSISTRATPAATAGRANGSATAQMRRGSGAARKRAAPLRGAGGSPPGGGGGAEKTRRLHQVRGALAQGGACQQVDIGVERKNEHPHRAAQAAHLG